MGANEKAYDIEIDVMEFQQRLEKGERLLISFGATWCGPCKQMLPTLCRLGTALEGSLRVGRIECDLHPELGKSFKISAYPSLVLFEGRIERGRVIGLQSLGQLKSWIEKTLPTGSSLEALAMTRPDWGAFYGNDFLRDTLVAELLRLAAEGKVQNRRFPAWDGFAGTPSAALVKNENPAVFERVTGMPFSFALVLELFDDCSEAGMAEVFKNIKAGVDVADVFLRLLTDWLADGEEEWSTHVADAGMDALRLRWVALMQAHLTGAQVPADDWAALREAVKPWTADRKEDEFCWNLGCFLRDMSPPPALDAQASILLPWLSGVLRLRHFLSQLQAGATPEVLATPQLIHEWFSSHWSVEAWGALSPEAQQAERLKMKQDLKPYVEAQAIVDQTAVVTRAVMLERFRARLLALLKACPVIGS